MAASAAPRPSGEKDDGTRSQPEEGTSPPERQEEVGEVHLIYQIEGKRNDVPVFELSQTLEGIGQIIQEADSVIFDDERQVNVKVGPFEEGSFVMDLVLSVQNSPAVLFFMSQPEAIERIKQVLEYLGLVKKTKEIFTSLLELIEFLKKGKPAKVEPAGPDVYNYYNQNGAVLPVNLPIHNLINNGTIQQFILPAIAAPLQRETVEAVKIGARPRGGSPARRHGGPYPGGTATGTVRYDHPVLGHGVQGFGQ
jgi:hypothetical protein